MVCLLAAFAACKQKQQQTAVQQQAQPAFYYTCSMHTQVHEDKPGNCPICGMKLIRVEQKAGNAVTGSKIMLTARQIALAGITTDTVREENIGAQKTITGTVTTNENLTEQLSARVAGRVQQLFVRTVGERVNAGQPVYAIYSEDLLEAEKEYLLALQQQKLLHNPDVDYKQLLAAAQNKLQLWGLSAGQIKGLAASGRASATVTVIAKTGGTVSEIAVHEGDYVTEGMPILKTQNLNALWVEAQLYADENVVYHNGDEVTVSFPDVGGQAINTKIEFVNPELADASKVELVQASIPNPHGLIKPGMLAYVSVSGSRQRALAVPVTAVLSSGKGNMVWVKHTDGSFVPQMVTTGTGNTSYVAVLNGLKAGDVVVTGGVYLLNSEAIFKNGDNAMAGMKM